MRNFTSTGMVALVALPLFAGCGGPKSNGEAKKAGPAVAADAAEALRQTGAVHAKGIGTESGKPAQLDLQLQGDEIDGSITLDNQPINIVVTGGQTYFKAPASFWKTSGVPAAAAIGLDNKWVKLPQSESKSLTSDLSFNSIADQIKAPTDGGPIQQPVKTGKLG